jgi:hypothetical protein
LDLKAGKVRRNEPKFAVEGWAGSTKEALKVFKLPAGTKGVSRKLGEPGTVFPNCFVFAKSQRWKEPEVSDKR